MPLIQSHAHGQFCWAELVAHDMPAAIRFYEQVMNWKANDLNESCDDSMPHVQFESEGQPVAGLLQLSGALKEAGLPSVWNTYVCVEDIAATLELAVQHGGQVTCPRTNAGEHGLIAFVQDPVGGVIGIWQKGSHSGDSLREELNSVVWNELASRDAKAACEFYQVLFGWTYENYDLSPSPYFMIRAGEGQHTGGIMQMTEEWGDMPSHWTIYFRVDAVDAFAVSIQKLEGTMLVAPFDTPVGRIAVLADNQGAAFNVIRLADETPGEVSAVGAESAES